MTNSQAKSELMQIYGMLSEEKKMALDVLMAQADEQPLEHDGCNDCKQNYNDMWQKKPYEPTCDTCEYNTATFNPCNACKDKSEYKPKEISYTVEQDLNEYTSNIEIIEKKY